MINYNKYFLFLVAALVTSALLAWLGESRGKEINIIVFIACALFSILYVPFVVIKLPVFNKYYTSDPFKINRIHHNPANYKAAPVMVGLVTGITLSLLLSLLDTSSVAYHSFLGASFATVISLYYEPKF